MSIDINIADDLASEYLRLKHQRDMLDSRMKHIEQQLTDVMPVKDAGSITTLTPHFKVTTTARQYRKVLVDQVSAVRKKIGRSMFNKVFRTKYELDAKMFKHLELNDPEIFDDILPAIVTTPGKTGIKVEEID